MYGKQKKITTILRKYEKKYPFEFFYFQVF